MNASASPPVVGSSLPRIDGRDKVTGRAVYVDDIQPAGVQYGFTVRSSIAHGTLVGIELDAKFDWSGLTVVTADHITGPNCIKLMDTEQPALVPVGGRIRHPDEPVALVCGEDRLRVLTALRHVTVQTTPLPAVLDLDAAARAEVKLYGEDNVLKRLELHKGSDVEAALAQAHVVVEGVYETGAQEQMYIEPQGMLARWETDAQGAPRVVVEGSMQCPYYVHAAIAELFGLEDTQVVIAQTVTGGGFGGKEEYPSMLAAHAALLAQQAKAPVKMIYTRSEDIGATTKRHPARIIHRAGFAADGTLLAQDIEVSLDGGAYLTLTPVVLSRAILHAAGPYRCPHVRVVGKALATNHPPHGAFRGFGAPQTTFAYERQMEKAAVALGMDPLALRRKNALELEDTTATGQVLRYSVTSHPVLDAIEEHRSKAPPQRSTASGAVAKGQGLSFYYHGAGFTGRGEERLKGKVAVAVTEAGGLEVRSASTDIGQGALTTFTQMAADALGVPAHAVTVTRPQTDMVPDSGPTVASRTCMVVGSVVKQAATGLRQRLEAFGRQENITGDVQVLARAYAERYGSTEYLATYQSPPGIDFNEETYTGDAYPVFGWAACWVEVSVDLDTYEVTIDRCIHAVDVGKAIHPIIVKGQIEGGTMQALGWALWEAVHYKDGRVLNRRMTDSIIPTAMEAPEMETVILENPYPHGPYGAKGVGEIPMDGPAAAVANAVADALGHRLKLPPDRVPLLPEVIERLVRGEAGGFWL